MTMTATKQVTWTNALRELRACEDAVEWAEQRGSLAEAWAECERGDWMLWYAARVGVRRQDLVLVACACARLALVHVRPGEGRPRIAIETAERWARGVDGVTLDDVRRAADASYAAAAAAADAAAAAAAYAAYAAYAAAAAYSAAAYSADAAADAAYARARTLRECAEIVRRHWPQPPEREEERADG